MIQENIILSQNRELSSTFIMKVFSYIALAMVVSAIGVFSYGSVISAVPLFKSPLILWGSLMALLLTSSYWSTIKPVNYLLFLLVAFLLGVSIFPLISIVVKTGGMEMLIKGFLATAGFSLGAGIYGATTKKDLSSWGSYLAFAIIGLIIVSILNIFFYSGPVSLLISFFVVIIFSLSISYQINTLKYYPEDMALDAALGLYMAIFNIFVSILQILLSFSGDD